MLAIEPGLTALGLLAASACGVLAASQDGPGWKKKIISRLRRGKGASALTDPAVQGGDWQQTAKTLEEQGRFRDAAGIFQSQGQNYESARLLLKAGALTEAASAFERVGHFEKAAEVCSQAGDNKRAAENYRNHLEDRFGSLAGTRSPTDHAEFAIAVSPGSPSSERVSSSKRRRFWSGESTGNKPELFMRSSVATSRRPTFINVPAQ